MAGEEIPRDHGYPLRAILPGLVGVCNLVLLDIQARHIKWLSRIRVGPEQSKSFFYQKDYKLIPAGQTFETFDSDAVKPVMVDCASPG